MERSDIERLLTELNEAENLLDLTPDQKSQVVDKLSHPDVQGWANGIARGGREEEREQEAFLWSTIGGYHREFDKVVIDPPMAAISWIVTGRIGEDALELMGSTIFEFDESVRIRRFWMYYNVPLA